MYELVICSHDGTVLKRFDLARVEAMRKRVVIGRAEDCDIRINAQSVSRHHVAIEPDDGDWIVRDLGSTLGTMIEGVKIEQADVRDGLTVQVGPALLKFKASVAADVAGQIARELGE